MKPMLFTREDVLAMAGENLPCIVFSDNLFSPMALLIRLFSTRWFTNGHTHRPAQHAMCMVEPGAFVSQGVLLRQVAAEYYLRHSVLYFAPSGRNPYARTG